MAAADPGRYEIVPVAISKTGRWLLPARAPAQLDAAAGTLPQTGEEGIALEVRPGAATLSEAAGPIDVVFPLLHGPYGEDGTVQGLLELAGIPYVGSGVLASAIGMDKEMQKRIFESNDMPVAPWLHVHLRRWERNPDAVIDMVEEEIGFPCFAKPAALGSSVGVSRCEGVEEMHAGISEALRHGEKAIVEKAIAGRELECAVLGNDEPEASVVGEIVPHRAFYDYAAKYLEEGSRLIVPAELPGEVSERVRTLALQAFRAIDASGMARVDFFLEAASGALWVNEINTIPGFTPISMYPRLWEASGTPYPKLIDRLIELAIERHGPQ
jgi:D-alanine-D-alanine ligase